MRPLVVAIAAALAAVAAGCLAPRTAGLCPEQDRIRCFGEAQYAVDRERGCIVAACRPWDDTSPTTPSTAEPEVGRGPALPPPGTRE